MKIYDFTLPLSVNSPVFPGTPKMRYEITHTVSQDHYNLGLAIINSHAGTHTDAPRHFLDDGCCLDGVDPAKYVGNAVIADCTDKKDFDEIHSVDLKRWEDKIRDCKRVLILTGWSACANEKKYYTDYPVITEELAQWLVDLGVVMVGVEPPSLNPPKYIEVHKILLQNGVAIVEGLTNLEKPEKDLIFFSGAPVGLKEADGFPIRALGVDFDT